MSRTVQCAKLGQELPGLEFAPLKGELGERIYNEISEEAWKQWIAHSIMVINEFRLNPSEPKAQEILTQQAEQFLFGDGVAPPEGFVPQK
ncbi:MAG: oxidative damage protection protein [Myxococcota bacterium]